MLRTEDDDRLAAPGGVVATDDSHGLGDRRQDAFRPDAAVVIDVVRRLGTHDGYGADVGGIAAFHVPRFPWAGGLVLGKTVGILGRGAQGGAVKVSRLGAGHVGHDQPHGPSDGSVAAPALPHGVVAGIDVQFAADGAVYKHHRRAGMCGCQDAVEIESVVREGLYGGDDNGQILGQATGHDGVDGDLFHGGLSLAGWQGSNDFMWRQVRVVQHVLHGLRRWRDDGEAVGQAVGMKIRLHLLKRVRQSYRL